MVPPWLQTMSLPRILVQVCDASDPSRVFGAALSAIIDTGASTNLIADKHVTKHWRVRETDVKFKGISGKLVPSAGQVTLIIRPLDPNTKQPIGESHPLEFFLSKTLGDDALLGMPTLGSAQIHCAQKLILFPLGKKTRKVNFIPIHCNLVEIFHVENSVTSRVNEKMNEPLGVLKSIEVNPDLPPRAIRQLNNMISQSEDCFLTDPNEVPLFKQGNHTPLKLELSSRVYTQPRHIPIAKTLHEQFTNQLNTWLRQGVCTKQTKVVPYRNNIVPVKKKDGTYRFTIDARNLNAIIADENVVIPGIPDILKKACGHRYYTQLDIASFFLCFSLDVESQHLLTFTNPVDQCQYRMIRTPFGCKCVMSNSIILLENELNRLTDRSDWLIAYIDDLLLFHDDLETHIRDLGRLFELLKDINVKLKPSKVKIAFRDIELFGYHLSERGFRIATNRIDSILKIPPPQNRKQLIRVLGQASYFRALLPTDKPMAYFTSRFRELVSAKNKFVWTESHSALWEEFRDALKRNLTLNRLLPTDKEMIVRSDASQTHFGGTLSTKRGDTEILLYTISKAWTPTVSRYHCSRLELIAALLTLYEFRMELIGRKCIIYTDNASVFFTLNNPERIEVQGTLFPRLFSQVRFVNYECRKTDNKDKNWTLVDLLSRANGKLVIARKNVLELLSEEQDVAPDECVLVAQLREVRTVVAEVDISTPIVFLRKFQAIADTIRTHPEFILKKVVPQHLRNALVKAVHLMGHLGYIPMLNILTRHNFNWPGRIEDLKQVIHVCTECGVFKPRNGKLYIRSAHLKMLEAKKALAIDIGQVGSPAKFSFLVCIDLFTGYVIARRISGRATSVNIINALLICLARYAPSCEVIRCDNASTFVGWEFKEFCKSIDLEIWYVARLNSRGNGKVERAIRSIKEQLRFMQLQSYVPADVDVALELASLAINLKPNSDNISPYTLNYGLMEPRNQNFLPEIRTSNPSVYQGAIADRISFFRELIRNHFTNDPPPAANLYQKGDLVRIKVNPRGGLDTLSTPKFSTTVFEIVDVKPKTLSYKLRNTTDKADIRFSHHRHVKRIITETDLEKLNKKVQAEGSATNNKKSTPTDKFHMKLRSRR